MGAIYITQKTLYSSITSEDILFTRFSYFDFCSPYLTNELHNKENDSCTHSWIGMYFIWDQLLELLCFTRFQNLASVEHWPPYNTTWLLTLEKYLHRMKFIEASILKLFVTRFSESLWPLLNSYRFIYSVRWMHILYFI